MGFKACPDCPRETVTWYAAVAFTRWLSAKTGEKIALPTEQQWQRAAQGDDGLAYPWGNEWDGKKCNNSVGLVRLFTNNKPTPVTQYPQGASPFGALDMSGNAWEWCATDFKTGEPELNGTNVRVLRGGSWLITNAVNFRAAVRSWDDPNGGNDRIGFRCARSS